MSLSHIQLIQPPAANINLSHNAAAVPPGETPTFNPVAPKDNPPTAATSTPPAAGPFVFSRSSPPVPAKMVSRIQALQFVEMRELLPDNIALAERLATLPQHSFQTQPTSQREVSSICSWTCAFATYVAVLAQAHPELVVSRLAYMRNLVREATRFGGEGWRTYDYVFRSQAATDKSTEWTTTNPSLMLAYMQNGLQPAKPPCPLCHESDHPPSSCALAPLSNTSHHWPARKSSYLGVPTNMPSRLPDGTQLCVSWNQGGCIAIGRCRYRHVCGSCGEGHIARDCAQTPEDSIFKRPPKRPAYARPPAPAPR